MHRHKELALNKKGLKRIGKQWWKKAKGENRGSKRH